MAQMFAKLLLLAALALSMSAATESDASGKAADQRTIRQQNLARGEGPIKFGTGESDEAFADKPGSKVVRLTAQNFDRHIVDGHKWMVIFYAQWSPFDKKLMPVWEELAEELHDEGIKVGKFDVEDASVQFMEIWDIRGFPTISVFVNGEFYKYDQAAERTLKAFAEFVRTGFSNEQSREMFNFKELDKKHNDKLYKDFEPIMELDAKNFDLRTSYGEWLILFTAPWCDSCADIEESLREVAKDLKGQVKVASIDGARHDEASSRFRIKGFPVIIRMTDSGVSYYKYTSRDRSAAKLSEWASKTFTEGDKLAPLPSTRKSDVVDLTDDNIDELTQMKTGKNGDWLIEFYAPWCGHCKQLESLWEEVATELKGEVHVGRVDATANRATAKRFRIDGFPTIMIFSDGEFRTYDGPRQLSVFTSFARGAFRQIRLKYPVPDAPKVAGVKPPQRGTSKPSRFGQLLAAMKTDFEKRPGVFLLPVSVLCASVFFLYRCLFSRSSEKKISSEKKRE